MIPLEDSAPTAQHPTVPLDNRESSWEQLLEGLDQVPAHDPRWDTVARFLDTVSELAARKIKERQFAIELEARIKKLYTHRKRPKGISLPSMSSLNVTLWSQLDEISKELLAQLNALEAKIVEMQAATSEEEAVLAAQIPNLSLRCIELWNGLSRLGVGDAEPRMASAVVSAQHEPVVVAADAAATDVGEAPRVTSPEVIEVEETKGPDDTDAVFRSDTVPVHALNESLSAEIPPSQEKPADIGAHETEVVSPLPEVVSLEHDEPNLVIEVIPKAVRDAVSSVAVYPDDLARRTLLNKLLADGCWSEAYWLACSVTLDPAVAEALRVEYSRMETLLDFLIATISIPVSREQALAVVHSSPVHLKEEKERILGFMIAVAGYPGTLARPMRAWLEYRPTGSPALIELADYLKRLQVELPLSEEGVSTCSELSLRQKEIESLRDELDRWRRETPKHPDWQVWAKLAFKEPRPLWAMVDSTLNTVTDPSEELSHNVRHLQDESRAKTFIYEYDDSGHRQMHTSMLRNLTNEITTLAKTCQRYLELVSADRDARRLVTADLVKLAEFRGLIADTDEAVVTDLNRYIDASPETAIRSAWLAGLRLWRWLTTVLDVEDSGDVASSMKSLYVNRNAALTLYPIERDDFGGIASDFLQDSRRMESVFELHGARSTRGELVKRVAERGDFRFIEDLRTIGREEQDQDALVQDLEGELQSQRSELAAKHFQAETAVARAWALGFIDEVQKARFESIVSEVGRQINSTRFLRPANDAINETLGSLTEKETAWVTSLQVELDTQVGRLRDRRVDETKVCTIDVERKQIESRFPHPAYQSAALSDLLERVRAAVNCDDTDDAARKLAGIGLITLIPQHLSAFLSFKTSAATAPGTKWTELWDLLQLAMNAASEFTKRGYEILHRIGLQEQHFGTAAAGKVRDYGNGGTGVCGIVEVRALVPSPIAQFGSGLTRLKLAIDGNPDGDLTMALTELAKLGEPAVPGVILFLGRLTPQQRLLRNIAATLEPEAERSTTVVIDRTLWEYLEPFERPERLSVVLHCALPFTYVNPFRAFGYVPREMFVGREDEIKAISGDPARSRLLYGGRQLGKSAILQEVQRRVDSNESRGSRNESRGSFCLLLDLRNKFRTQPPSNIWSEIRRAFAEKIRPKAAGSASPDATIAYIRNWLDESPSNKLFVLADEADSFLRADARRAYEETSKIAALMRNTEDRFRMIFAGTIDVGRHAVLKNAPLNEFGEPVIVLPALPRDARRMLELPLAALGIYLNESDVYQILARTNYYPGLIQFIGEKIVELNADNKGLPPTRISSDRIAKLLVQDSVRRMMIERFGLTLGLTDDYKCILYCLVQKQSATGLAVASLSDASVHKAVAEAWPRRFGRMPVNEFNIVLQELVPMGVLVRDKDGYRLRSPNLVPLLGSPSDLQAVLKGLERQDVDNLDDFHCLYDKEHSSFSPLSQAQETLIAGDTHNINMVLTPDVTQWNGVVESLRANRDDQFDFQVEVPAESLADYQSWYAKEGPTRRSDAKRITLVANLANVASESMPALLAALVPGPQLQRFRTVTFVIGLPCHAAIRYLSFGESQRAEWEKDRGLIAVHRWTLAQIRVALSDLEYTSTYEVGQRVEQVTGGWHFLLTHLFQGWKSGDDPQDYLAAFSLKIESYMGEAFLTSMGLNEDRYRQTVSVLHAGDYVWKEFDAARVAQEGGYLFDKYEPPSDLRAFVEYLIHLDVAQITNGRISVEPLTARLCGAQQ